MSGHQNNLTQIFLQDWKCLEESIKAGSQCIEVNGQSLSIGKILAVSR